MIEMITLVEDSTSGAAEIGHRSSFLRFDILFYCDFVKLLTFLTRKLPIYIFE